MYFSMNWFGIVFIVTTFSVISAEYNVKNPRFSRRKRDAVGSLDIITNNAQPIHADVKNDNRFSEKPCSNSVFNIPPSNIETGVTFKVLPPKDYHSLRKSYPLTTTLDLVRAVSRFITLVVLTTSAAIEFYPIVQSMFYTVYELVSFNKI